MSKMPLLFRRFLCIVTLFGRVVGWGRLRGGRRRGVSKSSPSYRPAAAPCCLWSCVRRVNSYRLSRTDGTHTDREKERDRERYVCSHSRVATLSLHCAHCSQPSTRRERASASTLRLISCARTFKYLQWAFVLIALHIFS